MSREDGGNRAASGEVAFDRELGETLGVGTVEPRSARLWLRLIRSGRFRLRLHDRGSGESARSDAFELRGRDRDPACDGTCSLRYPQDVPAARALSPARQYHLRLEREDGSTVGECRFETSPEATTQAPAHFSIAVMSCHQPFADDGEMSSEAAALLERAPAILANYNVKRVILLGDQMYADQPQSLSLFHDEHFARVAPSGRAHILECTAEEVRALYQQRHRVYWNSPGFKRIQSEYPCVCVPDDHEIVDNFGSAPEHSGPRWRSLRRGALQAVMDYQGLRSRDRDSATGAMDVGFRFGPVAVYVLDLRSERFTTEQRLQCYSAAQHRRLQAFMEEHGDAQVFALGLSVPLVHLPDWATRLGVEMMGEGTDIAERWANAKARDDRERLLRALSHQQRRFPSQKLLLLGGDVHAGMINTVRWPDLELRATQLISSPVSNSQNVLEELGASLASRLATVRDLIWENDGITECEVELAGAGANNPHGGVNVGILELHADGNGKYAATAKLVGVDERGAPRVLVSQPL